MTKLEEKIQEIFDNTKKKQFTGFSEDEFIDEEEAIEQLATLCRDYAEKLLIFKNEKDIKILSNINNHDINIQYTDQHLITEFENQVKL